MGKKRAGKGGCLLHWHDLEPWSEGVIAILLPREADDENLDALADLKVVYGRRGYMALFQRRRPGDAVRIDALARQAGRAGVRAVVTRYRARGAMRDVGKALWLPEDLTSSLAGLVWGWSAEGVGEKQVDELNLDIGDRRLRLTLDRADMLIVCTCGRTINVPLGKIVERFRDEGSVSSAAIRLVCKGCGRRGHASLTAVPKLRR